MYKLSKEEIIGDWSNLKKKYPDIEKISTDWLMFLLENNTDTASKLLNPNSGLILPGQFFTMQYNLKSKLDIHKKWVSGLIIDKNIDTIKMVNFNYILTKDKISLIRSNSISNEKQTITNLERDSPLPYNIDMSSIINWCISNAYPQALSCINIKKIDKIKLINTTGLPFLGLSNTNWLLNSGNQNIEYTEQVILNMRALQLKKSYQELVTYANSKLSSTVDDIDTPKGDVVDIQFLKDQLSELQRRLSFVNKQI